MTGASDSAEEPFTLAELLAAVELREIITYKVAAERVVNEVESIEDSIQSMLGMCRADASLVETRFQMTLEAPGITYFVDLGAVFRFERPSERPLTADVVNEFMSQVGVMAAFPYLREAVGGLAARMGGEIPVLGLLRRGEVQFQLGAGDGKRPVE